MTEIHHNVIYATVREGGDGEHHVECRFADGQKFAAVVVDSEHEDLAHAIAAFLSESCLSPAERENNDPAAWGRVAHQKALDEEETLRERAEQAKARAKAAAEQWSERIAVAFKT